MQLSDAELLENKLASAKGVAPTRELFIYRKDAHRIVALAGIEFEALTKGASDGPDEGYVLVHAHALQKACEDGQARAEAAKAEAETKPQDEPSDPSEN